MIIFPWKWDKEGTIVQIVRFLIQWDWFRVRWNVFKFYFLSAQYKRFKKFKIKENFDSKRNFFRSFFHFWALFNSTRIRRKYIYYFFTFHFAARIISNNKQLLHEQTKDCDFRQRWPHLGRHGLSVLVPV